VHGVEEPHGESELVRRGSRLERLDCGWAAARRPRERRVAGDRRVVRGDAIGVGRDESL
jgi:hypothetical protein